MYKILIREEKKYIYIYMIRKIKIYTLFFISILPKKVIFLLRYLCFKINLNI